MRADDAKTILTELFRPRCTDEKGHVASGLGKPAAKVAADSAGSDDKDPHRHVEFQEPFVSLVIFCQRWTNQTEGNEGNEVSFLKWPGPRSATRTKQVPSSSSPENASLSSLSSVEALF